MVQVIALTLAALLILLVSRYTTLFNPVRKHLDVVALPFYWIADLPTRMRSWTDENFASRQSLIEKNRLLENQLLIHKVKLQQMAALSAENLYLRQLMNSSKRLGSRVLVGKLIGISPDATVHKVIINKGSKHGVYIGQPLLDAFGLMGQVVSLTAYTSQVLLITDGSHALPVQVNRNGVRTVVEGIGDFHRLKLRHISSTTDIQQGDLLVSSGLGERFPVGYPVATVHSISHDPGKPFVDVVANPVAQLDRSRHVLFVFNAKVDTSEEKPTTTNY